MPSDVVQTHLKQARQWVKNWRNLLCIPSKWKIRTVASSEIPGYDAVVYRDKWSAEIQISTALLRSKAKWQRLGQSTVIHELLHVVLYPYDAIVEDKMDGRHILKAGEQSERVVRQLERAIEKIRAAERELPSGEDLA